jgi:tRNA pseudouridine55 synthase
MNKPAKRIKLNINGWINLDKPVGLTSNDALIRVRHLLGAAKAGHGGTLDPLATGVLPIALGEATKILHYVTDTMKTYEFTITWGEQRDTDDNEGKIIATSENRPTAEQITRALPAFIGGIMQLPPKYSALKVDGERAYDLARAGTEFELKPRPVFIESLTLKSTTPETATLSCHCGKGTYVRSIARDLAEALGTKGYISALRRTLVAGFDEISAISLDKLTELVASSAPTDVVLPLGAGLDDIPALQTTQAEAVRLKQGQAIELVSRADVDRLIKAGLDPRITDDSLALATFGEQPVALLSATGPRLQPVRVFNL